MKVQALRFKFSKLKSGRRKMCLGMLKNFLMDAKSLYVFQDGGESIQRGLVPIVGSKRALYLRHLET
jgi:hypothetical protein